MEGSAAKPIVVDEDFTQPVATVQQHSNDGSMNDPVEISDDDEEYIINLRQTPPNQFHQVVWPSEIPRWSHCDNPEQVRFDPDRNLGRCKCTFGCYEQTCLNAQSAIYCQPNNCNYWRLCENRLTDCDTLTLIQCAKGYGVVTLSPLETSTIIGEYCGRITTQQLLTADQVLRGYVLKFKSSSVNGQAVFVDASIAGSICRFVNHSCSPNSRFEERANRRSRKMVIVTHTRIAAGEEITVRYENEPPFECLCNADNCISKRRNITTHIEL